MKIKEFFDTVSGAPKSINLIDCEKHIWIGDYNRAPEEIKDREFKKACIHGLDRSDYPCTVFYL